MYSLVEELNYSLNTLDNEVANVSNSNNSSRTAAGGSGKSPSEKTPVEIFNDIKSLIIKSADIVNAYYEKMKLRFDGLYTAQSEFGTFVQQTNTAIELANDGIAANVTSIQGLTTDLVTVDGELQTLSGTVDDVQAQMLVDEASIEANATAITTKVSQTLYDTDMAAVNEAIQEADADIDALGTRVSSAESTITQHADLIATKVSTSTYEQGLVTTLNTAAADATSKANTAQATAISTASADATSKANAAQTAAAADATSKANAAEAAANAYTDDEVGAVSDDLLALTGRVTTAESSITQQATEIATKVSTTTYEQGLQVTLQTAASDASTKASAAQAAAEATASADATSKANAAQTAAEATASADATNKANAAQAAAEATSADDATNKANAAQTAAMGYTDAEVGAVSDEVYILTNRVTAAESSITQQSDLIATKVSTSTYEQGIAEVNLRMNGKIESYHYGYVPTLSNFPASEWVTAEERASHIGDLFFDTTTGYEYRFEISGEIPWESLADYTWEDFTDTAWMEVGRECSWVRIIDSDVTNLQTRMTSAESSITQQSDLIATKVSETDFTGNTIASKINQTATTIKLQANKLALEGYTTINDGFSIDESGNATMHNATIDGDIYFPNSTSKVLGGQGLYTNLEFNGSLQSKLNERNVSYYGNDIGVGWLWYQQGNASPATVMYDKFGQFYNTIDVYIPEGFTIDKAILSLESRPAKVSGYFGRQTIVSGQYAPIFEEFYYTNIQMSGKQIALYQNNIKSEKIIDMFSYGEETLDITEIPTALGSSGWTPNASSSDNTVSDDFSQVFKDSNGDTVSGHYQFIVQTKMAHPAAVTSDATAAAIAATWGVITSHISVYGWTSRQD